MRRSQLCIAVTAFVLATLPLAAQTLITTVPVGNQASYLAPNTATNKIYVNNFADNTVTVINGVTNATSLISVGQHDEFLAINPVTNKIYVNNRKDGTVSVVDGNTDTVIKTIAGFSFPIVSDINTNTNKIYVTNSGNGNPPNDNSIGIIDGHNDTLINTVTVGLVPTALAVNSATNKIYVINVCGNDNNCQSQGTVTVVDGATLATSTVTVGYYPGVVLIDQVTNKIYVMNSCGTSQDCFINGTTAPGTVTIIDGATNSVQTIAVGTTPIAVGVNAATNQIYVANYQSGSVTIVDGTTNETTTVSLATSPNTIAVDAATNKIYVTSFAWTGTVTMIDGADDATTSVAVGIDPTAIALNLPANSLYVTNAGEWDVSVIGGGPSYPLQFVPVVPCRVADTRGPQGPFGAPSLAAGVARAFSVPQSGCNIPDTAMAFSLNVTAVPPPAGRLGYLTIWPTGESEPTISTLNSTDGRIKANAALVPAGADGSVTVYASDSTDLVLDINGYFASASPATLQFYPVAPCRVLDTRNAPGDLGGPSLERNQERDFPVLSSNCQIPPTAQAYSMNITVVPVGGQSLGFLTLWPAGQDQPVVSTLNNPKATVVANAAIVPAGTGGAIAVYPNQNTDLVADINGYFAAPGMGGMSFYPSAPCRVIDTRSTGGAFVGQRTPAVDVVDSSCGIPSAAQAYVFNATVVPQVRVGYLTLWPHGESQPVASTLNALDGFITSNMAILPNLDGNTNAYASGVTQLILDISSYFAP